MAMLHMRDQKLVKEHAKGVRLEMILQGIIGLGAIFASTKQNKMERTTEAAKQPTTVVSDQDLVLPPREVATTNDTTASTMVTAPA